MFTRFHEAREREDGFTLIELLVVILIIAILAAIAIPVFLNQRKKGWVSQLESALKNMATTQESYLVSSGVYADTGELNLLESEGFKYSSADVTPEIVNSTAGTAYCLKATSMHDTTIVRYYDSDDGRPVAAACT